MLSNIDLGHDRIDGFALFAAAVSSIHSCICLDKDLASASRYSSLSLSLVQDVFHPHETLAITGASPYSARAGNVSY